MLTSNVTTDRDLSRYIVILARDPPCGKSGAETVRSESRLHLVAGALRGDTAAATDGRSLRSHLPGVVGCHTDHNQVGTFPSLRD